MTTPTAPAEHLLLLAADFTRHNDALTRLRLNGTSPATALTHHTSSTQHLANSALHIVDTLNTQPMYHSPVIRTVYARVRQLAHLATSAADHLLDAVDILNNTRPGIPVHGQGPLLTHEQALRGAGSRLTLVRDLTDLGAHDAVTTAEVFVTERRHRGAIPSYRPPALSPAQDTALRAVARGEVTVTDDKPSVRRDNIRITIRTIRSLESRHLVAREPCPRWLHDQRIHLTSEGCRGLAATFGRPRTPALTTARPAGGPAVTSRPMTR
ncbi:hypothetical protein [Streptomyces niveus]|uniref:Uncharacterized protein n=1 Tax=Streptomyces niveus TaxID=193462 RepID=A0A1U9QKV2_STRNV|nr:hypothetical protein [Streptomyces niveus]AQU64906.1 hypothetical protein BBN63_00100 [Streptomyces niveus]